ncbi:ribbon-helix-helix domain-containing protein [Halogranum rubrum]|uniref:Uncharacterized protein n=1 Tax=Halogranum salarium B-1 TaxID=1210908 RepID=J3JDU1_9EURY|nr:ribbon-helix-helix domain-containing protein [Halogranum salarium]EJN57784.1 hypothetical protein HSB1_38690 [Halogranum salarium B-1]
MKIVIDVPEEIVREVKEAVKRGGYEDSKEFIRTAIETQIELETSEQQTLLTFDDAFEELEQSDSLPHNQSKPEPSDVHQVQAELENRSFEPLQVVNEPDRSRLDDGPLWGQYNRVFPIKLVTRRLANVLLGKSGDEEWIELERFSDQTATVARNVGKKLLEEDEAKSRGRGEKLSAALPIGDNAQKSMDRFKSHFVGYSDRNGNLTGAPAHLLFVDITSESPSKIGLTDAGRQLASIHNPLLDDGLSADEALSRDEVEFLVSFFREELPAEYEAMLTIARAIENDQTRPTQLTERIATLNQSWTDAQAKTIRSGLVSRMYEMGMVKRHRVGQRGTAYELTLRGESLLKL